MPKVKFTSALKRFFPNLAPLELTGDTVRQVIDQVDTAAPGISQYILEEDGSLRKHVNIFIKEEMIQDRTTLSDPLSKDDEILIYQALSGG